MHSEKTEEQKEGFCKGGLSAPAVTKTAAMTAEGRAICIHIFLTVLSASMEEVCEGKIENLSPDPGNTSNLRCHHLFLVTSTEALAIF